MPSVIGPAGLTFTTLGDNSVLVGGTFPATGTYSVWYSGAFSGITGVRLEVIEDPSLPFSGPGSQVNNGNLVLSEITLTATSTIPEPTTLTLFAIGLAGLGFAGWRRRAVEPKAA